MKDQFVQSALKNFCQSHEIFGESSVYERFEQDHVDNANDGFNSTTLFGRIVYRNGEEERVSPPIMIKTVPRVPFVKDCTQVQFFNEIFFHTRALPMFQQLGDAQSLLAHLYDSQIHLNGRAEDFALIFENLRPQGFRLAEPYSFLDFTHLSLMLRKLGNFHAYSYLAKKKNPKEFYAVGKWFYNPQNVIVERLPNKALTKGGRRGLQRLREDPHYSQQLENVEKIIENTEEFLNSITNLERENPTSVLCHGDYTRGNVMFRYDENGQPCDLKMIDMAWSKIASPVVDLSTVLYLNADQSTRNLHWDELIDSYYGGLTDVFGGEVVPTRNGIVDEFRTRAMYGYVVASYFLVETIARDRGMKTHRQLVGEEYANCSYDNIPERILNYADATVGGAEATDALANILRDIIDRNFV